MNIEERMSIRREIERLIELYEHFDNRRHVDSNARRKALIHFHQAHKLMKIEVNRPYLLWPEVGR